MLNNLTFDQQDLSTGLKTQNVEKLSLDLIFIAMLRIHSKPTEFSQNRTEISKNFQCGTVSCILSDRNSRTLAIFQKFLIFSLDDSFIPSYESFFELYDLRKSLAISADYRRTVGAYTQWVFRALK